MTQKKPLKSVDTFYDSLYVVMLHMMAMNTVSLNGILTQSLHHPAFILYRPQKGRIKDRAFYNEEASKILSYFRLKEEEAPPFNFKPLCLRWRKLIDKRLNELSHSDKGEGPDSGLIDIIQSYRRRYAVRGIILSGHSSASKTVQESSRFSSLMDLG